MRFTLLFSLALCATQPALAQCVAPVAPRPLHGAKASEAQLRAALAQARDFIAQSDLYQNCLTAEASPSDITEVSQKSADSGVAARIAASEALKERVGAAANAAMQSYKRAHSR